jgi:glycosyltransferase involved in cell wall biosynthesis
MASTRTAILMPLYQSRPHELERTMQSLLAQTERADIVIVDDGSTPPARDLLGDVDGVVHLRLPTNKGIVAALNHGVAYCLGHGYEFIARMDCGDTCKLDRIAKQQAFMDRNPDIDLVGAVAEVVDERGEFLFIEGVPGGTAVRNKLWDNPAFKHPTFLFRSSCLKRVGAYSPNYLHADEYELMRRIARSGKLYCMDEVLLVYEKNTQGISIKNRRAQLMSRLNVQRDYFDWREPRAYVGVLRTLVTLAVPAALWARISQHYWRVREKLAVTPARQ